jgi:hypothetical protein
MDACPRVPVFDSDAGGRISDARKTTIGMGYWDATELLVDL